MNILVRMASWGRLARVNITIAKGVLKAGNGVINGSFNSAKGAGADFRCLGSFQF